MSAKPRTTAAVPMSRVLGKGDLGTSLLFVTPLFLIYEVGVLFTPSMNGVDFVSRNLFAAVGHSRTTYLLVQGALLVAFLVLLGYLRRRKSFDARRFPPMLLESAIYALTLGSLIWFVMHRILGFEPTLAAARVEPGVLTKVVLSFGAGVHEELVFRLGLCAGGAALVRALGLRHGAAVALAFLVSSALFSGAHHVGALGDAFALDVFVYRLLAGLVFATIFYYRSLAHAVYTHALYDVYVMVLR